MSKLSAEEWKSRVKAVAREVFQEMFDDYKPIVKHVPIEGEDTPPEPKTIRKHGKGRKENRKYKRLTVAIDVNLAERFEAEMRSRSLSAGKLMDVILWNRYGKIPLSYHDGADGGLEVIDLTPDVDTDPVEDTDEEISLDIKDLDLGDTDE
jgi:hypothetical protein